MYLAIWLSGALTGVLALWAAYFAIVDRAVIFKQLIFAAVIEAVVVVTAIIAGIHQARGYVVSDAITLWGYLLTCLILLPIAGAWAFVDRTRTSSIAMVIVSLSQVVCLWRVWQIWVA